MAGKVGEILDLVRNKLRATGVKLWLEPYYIEDLGGCDTAIENLAHQFAAELAITPSNCRMALSELQHHAIDKLHANNEFAATGVAKLRVRTPVNNTSNGGARTLTLRSSLDVTGAAFQQQVATELGTTAANIRIICAGHFIKEPDTLASQGVRNHDQMMAVLTNAPASSSPVLDPDGAGPSSALPAPAPPPTIYEKIAQTRADTELLVALPGYMEMEDQSGNTVHLPPAEQRSLIVALALHEKGKGALRRSDFSEALVWLLEADEEYTHCNSQMLQTVDNFALLNLDVVWCYLCLKSVAQLPEAEKRLRICERSFRSAYGENLNRVLAVKGQATSERALVMRLHLLQAVIHYHSQRIGEAATLLLQADRELRELRVCEQSMRALVEMGYTEREARIALRACRNSVDESLTHILEAREERAAARRKNRAERKLAVTRSRDQTWVNPRSLCALIERGFEKRLAEVALRRADNDLERAVLLLQTEPEELRRQWAADWLPDGGALNAMVGMGFDREMATQVLQWAENDLERALEALVRVQQQRADEVGGGAVSGSGAASGSGSGSGSGSAATATAETVAAGQEELWQRLEALMAEDGEAAATASADAKEAARKFREGVAGAAEDQRDAESALERMADGVDEEADDHLDLPLEQEESFVAEYKRYMNL